MRRLLLILLLGLLTACGTDTITPSPVYTTTPALPTPSPSPEPSATPVPTATPAPLSFAEQLYVSGVYSDVESITYLDQQLQPILGKPDPTNASWAGKVIALNLVSGQLVDLANKRMAPPRFVKFDVDYKAAVKRIGVAQDTLLTAADNLDLSSIHIAGQELHAALSAITTLAQTLPQP